ncbi:MAG: hypothetical protein ABIV06_04685 [Thermoanaerobaculia bacterium]
MRWNSRPALIVTAITLLAVSIPASASAQLGSPRTQFYTLGMPGTGAPLQGLAQFGGGMAAGDFNCDGFDDLAAGAPAFDFDGDVDTGAVLVLYGSEEGLHPLASQWVTPPVLLNDLPEPGDRFGYALAAGDFDGDGCAELAIGAPFETLSGEAEAGAVTIFLGGEAGLSPGYAFYQSWTGTGTIGGAIETGDHFGQTLLAHDFDRDGFDDLAVGVPREDIGTVVNAGAVHVLFGSAAGVNGVRDILLYRGGAGDLPGEPESAEELGFALAGGELNPGNGHELAIGCPGRSIEGGPADAGSVLLAYNLASGPLAGEIHLDGQGVFPLAESGDRFGAALAAGDYNGDGRDELTVGIPGRSSGALNLVGALAVRDFDPTLSLFWLQGQLNPETTQEGDEFAATLLAADFTGDGIDDLAIGVPREDLSSLANAGLLHVVHGSAGAGLTNSGDQIWTQVLNPPEDEDRFAAALAAGRFAGHSGADLAIGVPFEEIAGEVEAGAVNLLYSIALFRDGFEDGNSADWSVTVP